MNDFAALYHRDITRLRQEIDAYATEDALWLATEGISNPAGNLCLHLIGNLRTFIGLGLGGYPYVRDRPAEFASRNIPKAELLAALDELLPIITDSVGKLSEEDLKKPYPDNPLGYEMSVGYFLIHLNGHLNYHLGQIDYHRRILTHNGAIPLASK